MRTRKAPFALALLLVASASADAVETPGRLTTLTGGGGGGEAYASAREALRSGVRTYNAGDKAGAVNALEFAADQGYPLALWKLGRMFAEGDGVPRNDVKAFGYFSRLADENADEAPGSDRSGLVASAFVALGSYFLDGIANSDIKPNAERALELFHYAAAYFGDPTAQYSLARLYLGGTGTEQDARQAARWLNLAAEKGHHAAQALLGRMLVAGEGGVPREPARGLAWLTMAKNGADPAQDAWIASLYADAFAVTSDADKRSATAYLEQYRVRRR